MKIIIVRIAAIICATVFLVTTSAANAQDARLENIIVTNTRDNLLLYLTAKDAFPPKIITAIQSGVPATFTFYINLYLVRGLWFDKKITDIQLETASCNVPLIPCPLVQPLAQREPKPIKIPPTKAVINRGITEPPNACSHSRGTHCTSKDPDSNADRKEPIKTPINNIHRQFTSGGYFR